MKKIILMVAITIISLYSCKKKEFLTVEKTTTNQLKSVISENQLKRVIAYVDENNEPMTIFLNYGIRHSFNNGYITIFDGFNDISYNLSFLKSYKIKELEVRDGTNTLKKEKALLLLFK